MYMGNRNFNWREVTMENGVENWRRIFVLKWPVTLHITSDVTLIYSK
jgi:hypothetical protein